MPCKPTRHAALFLAAAAAIGALAGGCADTNNSGSSPSAGRTNSPAVHAPGTTDIKDSSAAGAMGSTQYFPHGTKNDAVLKMDVSGPKSVRVNQPATFQFTITNLTEATIHGVILSSNNPGGLGLTSNGTAPMPLDEKTAGYPVGDLAAGESKTVTLTGTASKVGQVDTCYTALFTPPALCTIVQVTNPAVELVVEAPAEADICVPLAYKYTVKNTGTGTARNVTVKQDLPEGLTTADGNRQVMADLKDIPQGESRTATADLKATRRGTFDGQAMAMTDGSADGV